MKTKLKFAFIAMMGISLGANAQTLSEKQMQNARATGYSIVASRNPNVDFSVYMIPWDGVNTLEHNANTQINSGWHAQAVIKGNYFYQNFDGNDFTKYSSVILSQEEFNRYKHTGTQWWIVCSTLPPFSEKTNFNGNVGIGTSNTGNWKLAVNGKIRAKEIKVETGWSDFVFYDDYELPTLTEVERHIQEQGHLKDIPSAEEVAKDGIFLGQMDAKLLQKIEELTLYTIEQEKKLKSQSDKIESLERQNSKIERQEEEIKELKSLVSKLLENKD